MKATEGTENVDRWSTVLDAAENLIRSRGADGWSLADLAGESRVSEEDIHAEFDSEWDVFSRTIARDEERWETAIRETPHRDASERIVHLLRACVPDYDWTFWIELWSMALREQPARELREELDQGFRAFVEELVQDGVDSGEFSVDDARSTAITIGTLIDAMALQATLGDTTVRPNYMFDACVTVTGVLLGVELSVPKLVEPENG